jgi:hypothetical protein
MRMKSLLFFLFQPRKLRWPGRIPLFIKDQLPVER